MDHRVKPGGDEAGRRFFSFRPREAGEGDHPERTEGWWRGRLTRRAIFAEGVSLRPAPPPPRSARSPSPVCTGAESAGRCLISWIGKSRAPTRPMSSSWPDLFRPSTSSSPHSNKTWMPATSGGMTTRALRSIRATLAANLYARCPFFVCRAGVCYKSVDSVVWSSTVTVNAFGACLSFGCVALALNLVRDESIRPNPLQCLSGSLTGKVLTVGSVAALAGCDEPDQPHTRLTLSSVNGTVGSSVASVVVTELEGYRLDAPRPPNLSNQAPPPLWLDHVIFEPPRWHTPNYTWPPPTPIAIPENETVHAGATFFRSFWKST
jgi:hypothetical protein